MAVAALAGFAQAQIVDVIPVKVGSNNGTFRFYPEKITAPEGSVVQFQFIAGNHTVTQSNFDNPCTPLGLVNPEAVGIRSGFQPVQASANMGQLPVFNVWINDTRPIWLYCAQGAHCQNGMSMVINENTQANETRSLENYKALAASLAGGAGGNAGQPGAGNGAGNGGSTGGDAGAGGDADAGADGTDNNNPGQGGAEQGDVPDVPAAAYSLAVPTTLLLALGTAFLLV
ncbi:hypothetical protein SODALDRAFT_325743 [Sodiomyces alkalinus F11]|uniref:Cupredoxin n=1 Tax=Sodiomyces alkalinus (strain CBS 110278 / VKM F-3762 / F11) TaxID=1314773 RepID=A0A3N2PPG3_SODAK|nr:hypothetical protein SODALDRAFT_325743 [Sodiomyces alkalinus F11]ROT36401.1 hypothetical protein SODALDRAFT_325743 [Sodiomyces alkalinus F11]